MYSSVRRQCVYGYGKASICFAYAWLIQYSSNCEVGLATGIKAGAYAVTSGKQTELIKTAGFLKPLHNTC